MRKSISEAFKFVDEGGSSRKRIRSNQRREMELAAQILNPEVQQQVSPVGGGVRTYDSAVAAVLSSVGNDGCSSVVQVCPLLEE